MSCSPLSALNFYFMGLLDIGAAAINAVGNHINSVAQNRANERLVDKQNAFNAAEAEKARQATSVASQIQQMKANGFNAAAQGTTPVSQGSPSAAASQAIPNVGLGVNDLGLLASQIKLNESAAEKNDSETTGQDVENKFKADLLKGEIAKNNVTIRGLTFDVDNMKPEQLKQTMAQTNQLNASAANLAKSIELMQSQISKNEAETLGQKLSNYYDNATLQARIRAAGLDNRYKETLIQQTEMLIKKGYAEIPLIEAETRNAEIEGGVLALTYDNGKIDFDIRTANLPMEKEAAKEGTAAEREKAKVDKDWTAIDKYFEKGVQIVDMMTGCATAVSGYKSAKALNKMSGAAERNAGVNSARLDFDVWKVDNPTRRKRKR